jgi:tRNA (mo5U34)-methyltransferase
MTDDKPYESGLILSQTPELSLLARDPAAGLEFESETAAPDPEFTWYHTITFPDGEVTPGIYDHRDLVQHYGLPDEMAGLRALDVGTADGFWAFEMEKRGADVTAVDLPSSSDLDFPPQVREIAIKTNRIRGTRFREAHRRIGSHVIYEDRSVYLLSPDEMGDFDLVHAGDLLLHLERPLEALRRMRDVTKPGGTLIVSDAVDPSLPPREGQGFLVRYLGGWDTHTWWNPSVDALGQMILDSGFKDVTIRALYMLPHRRAGTGVWRGLFHARR